MSQEDVHVVRAAFAASARGDAEGFMSALDPAIEWTPVKQDPDYAVHRGLQDVAAWLAEWAEVFPDVRWEVERIVDAGDQKVVALVRVRGRGGATGADVGNAALRRGLHGPLKEDRADRGGRCRDGP